MSRIAAETVMPCSVRSGLRLTSIGISVPSLRRPKSSSPEPIGRAPGCAKKRPQCPACACRKRSGIKSVQHAADELRARVAEQLLGLDVDQVDPSVVADDDHRVRGGVQQLAVNALRSERRARGWSCPVRSPAASSEPCRLRLRRDG